MSAIIQNENIYATSTPVPINDSSSSTSEVWSASKSASEITTINNKIDTFRYLTFTISAETGFTDLSYPDGFNYSNCVIISYFIDYTGIGQLFFSDLNTFYVCKRTNGISVYNERTDFKGKTCGVYIRKIS